jgi:ribosomal protein S18 acetylase RimI-like enzyme
LAIAEEDDLPDVSRLTIDAFGDIAVSLSSDLNNLERAILSPGVALWNGYTGYVAYTEVLSGLRTRMKDKLHKVDLSPPPVKDHVSEEESEAVAARSSLILALARSKAESDDSGGTIDVIATVELRLQPTDAKIPFSQPWLDSIERKAAKALGIKTRTRDEKLQPYLSNLCVAESARGRRIGKALVRCVEQIASDTWGYDKIYLHVDLENVAALNLYKSEGYEDVGLRWNVPWAGGASDIGYFVKKLKASNHF